MESASALEVQDSKFEDKELLQTKTVLLTGSDVNAKRAEIREYFHKTFTLFERLHEVLRCDETLFQQPDKLRHPLIFYLGHTACFYVNKLKLAKILKNDINKKIESICAVGVDEMSWDDLNQGHYDWPSAIEVRRYRDVVRSTVDSLIQTMELSLPITWTSPFWLILMGCEHERIHIETSSVLMRQLPLSEVRPHPFWRRCLSSRSIDQLPVNSLVPVPGGVVKLGKPFSHHMYGWDNEYGEHRAEVSDFSVSRFLVSNGEYLAFVQAGGYRDKQWWTEEGWNFVQYRGFQFPLFWIYRDPSHEHQDLSTIPPSEFKPACFRYRSINEEFEMPWDWPVDVSCLEAQAFCQWKSSQSGSLIRLPTEEEWCRMRDYTFPPEDGEEAPYWPFSKAPGNINLEHHATACPVDAFEFRHGVYDVVGNVWQHTETPIAPFKGFKVHPIYDDFTVPTFDMRHNMIKGGSFISTGNEATRHARYAFRRHFYQHAGFRYIETKHPAPVFDFTPEPEPAVSIMNEFHYSSPSSSVSSSSGAPSPLSHVLSSVPNFPVALAQTVVQVAHKHGFKLSFDVKADDDDEETKEEKQPEKEKEKERVRVLEVGCGAGRTSFELARAGAQVTSLDVSTRFFRTAVMLQSGSQVRYSVPSEGELNEFRVIDPVALDLVAPGKHVEFMQSDGCNLAPKFSGYGVVLCSNLTDMHQPAEFLASIHQRLTSGGLLVISSAFNWNEAQRETWLGGFKQDGESLTSVDSLARHLSAHFRSVEPCRELLAVTRQHDRSFVFQQQNVSFWQRL